MEDVAQGFSYLANPYKDDGSAKTVGEMIFEGSQAVSGSRAERKKTAQAGELAAQEVGVEKLKSDIAISEAEKDRAAKIEIAKLSGDEYLKKTPLPRLILDMTTQILKTAVPGSFEYKNASGLAKGKAIAAKMASEGITVGVIEDWVNTGTTKEPKWDYRADNMRSDMAWFDPTTNQWHVYNDNGNGMVTGDPVKSFLTVEEAVAYLKGGNLDIIPEEKSLESGNESTENASTVSMEVDVVHPTVDGTATGEISDEYILEYATKNKIPLMNKPDGTPNDDYRGKGGKDYWSQFPMNFIALKNSMKNDNAPSIFKDTDAKKEKRKKDQAFSWFDKHYEKGNKIMPARHGEYLDEWLEIKETLTAQKTDTKHMGS
jgi:hypothetical protein